MKRIQIVVAYLIALALVVSFWISTDPAAAHDDLRRPLKGEYYNFVRMQGSTSGASRWFQKGADALSSADTNFSVRKLTLDATFASFDVICTVNMPSSPTGTQAYILEPGSKVVISGHVIDSFAVSSGPTAGGPFYVIGER